MAALKNLFEKYKLNLKFKKVGKGQKLSDQHHEQQLNRDVKSKIFFNKPEKSSEDATKRAAQAAVLRYSQPKQGSGLGTSQKSVELQVRRELEAEAARLKEENKEYSGKIKELDLEKPSIVSQVFFSCPLIGPAVLPKREIEEKIREFLYEQLVDEPEIASAMMIQSFNKDPEKIKQCVDTLCKYLDNMAEHPDEEKYRKIRIGNKLFQERVDNIEGANEFLQAVGFERKLFPGSSGDMESFYVIPDELAQDCDHMRSTKSVLLAAEPIKPQLDRCLRVFHPSPYANQISVPPDFFAISAEELKREQQRLHENAEKLGVLRTKEMRERDRIRELRRYRYVCIRIRLPDDLIIQGTFKAIEKLKDVVDFIKELLANSSAPFSLSLPPKNSKLDLESTSTLAELGLAPAALLVMNVDERFLKAIAKSKQPLFRPDVRSLACELIWNP